MLCRCKVVDSVVEEAIDRTLDVVADFRSTYRMLFVWEVPHVYWVR